MCTLYVSVYVSSAAESYQLVTADHMGSHLIPVSDPRTSHRMEPHHLTRIPTICQLLCIVQTYERSICPV